MYRQELGQVQILAVHGICMKRMAKRTTHANPGKTTTKVGMGPVYKSERETYDGVCKEKQSDRQSQMLWRMCTDSYSISFRLLEAIGIGL